MTTAPSKLSARSRRLWTEITGTYELRADELRVLEDACREADLVDELSARLRGAPMLISTVQGDIVNPLVREVRQHRTVLAGLLRSLRLPDDSTRSAGEASSKARAAVAVRWAARGA